MASRELRRIDAALVPAVGRYFSLMALRRGFWGLGRGQKESGDVGSNFISVFSPSSGTLPVSVHPLRSVPLVDRPLEWPSGSSIPEGESASTTGAVWRTPSGNNVVRRGQKVIPMGVDG
jgi:hypothetical protein